jgi:hypothetical protein
LWGGLLARVGFLKTVAGETPAARIIHAVSVV